VAQQTSMFENLEGYTDDVDKKRGDGNGW
jgi:hypothetical protein